MVELMVLTQRVVQDLLRQLDFQYFLKGAYMPLFLFPIFLYFCLMKRSLFVSFTIVISTLLPIALEASDYGTTGLIDIPSARMQQDGLFTSTAAFQSRSKSIAITYQMLPWLEGTFRYTGFNDFFLYDRNYEIKARLIEETRLFPQVALGIRDVVGTGVFGAEYIVANKQMGNVDLTLGVGWGRLSGNNVFSNPLIKLNESFRFRDNLNDYNQGGTLSGGQFFKGEKIGVFGGISYTVPNTPVRMIAEYNPDKYEYDVSFGAPHPRNPYSFGLEWQLQENISVLLSHQHGQEWGLSFQAKIDTTKKAPKFKPAKFISAKDISQQNLPQAIDKNSWYDTLLYDIEHSGALMMAASLDSESKSAEIVLGNQEFVSWPQLVQTAHNLAEVHLPENVKVVDYLIEDNGHYATTIRMPRLLTGSHPGIAQFNESASILPGRKPASKQYYTNFVKDKIVFDIELSNRLMLFDPDNPLGYQFFAKIGTKIELPERWQLRAAYAQNITNNFQKFIRSSNSTLPHVRSDAVEYLREGESGLEQLYLGKRGTISRNVHYRVYAGILESMYSGVGGELLFMPYQSRLAFGLSGNWVKQREFDRSFKHRDYSAPTAFASVYWATPWYQYDAALHVGKYLAKDTGATLEVRRTFDNGWMLGMWATMTDVPYETFGEGSFDKGIFLKIPIAMFGGSSRATYTSRIRPVQRDGGARLEGYTGQLWWDLRDVRYDVFDRALMP